MKLQIGKRVHIQADRGVTLRHNLRSCIHRGMMIRPYVKIRLFLFEETQGSTRPNLQDGVLESRYRRPA